MSLELLPDYIEKINNNFENETDIKEVIVEVEQELSDEQIALLLESFPIKLRIEIWLSFSDETQQNVFIEMKPESRELILNACDDELCFPLLTKLDAVDLLELSESFAKVCYQEYKKIS